MMYLLKDREGNTTFMANEQIFSVIKEMRKLNKRMCRFMDNAETETDKELTRMYVDWSDAINNEIKGMAKAFNMLTGYEISIANLLFDKIEEIA